MVLQVRFRGDIREKFESDSAQANTAQSRKLKWSQIQNWLTMRGVKHIFLFLKISISREFRIHMMIFRKCRIFSENPKVNNTAQSWTLRSRTPCRLILR